MSGHTRMVPSSARHLARVAVALFAACMLALAALPLREAAAQAEALDLVPPLEPQNGGVVELRFTPTRFAQLAVWIESADGEHFSTVRLTEAVALRGIGNRPGASQMNSGFHWPYGRREGVLPVWASRRAAAPGAQPFRRVIFQKRITEGLASQTSADQSPDDYYCLSFDRSRSSKDALDAITCATQFSSDKGRFITESDVAAGYAEPYEDRAGEGRMRPMPLHSLYPPRRDVNRCFGSSGCYDHVDVDAFAAHAREVMPEIDAVTMATPSGDVAQRILFEVPKAWPAGAYRACVEANVEGDYNNTWNAAAYPTPRTPQSSWDTWAIGFGYPYRGQPSIAYCADIELGDDDLRQFSVSEPLGTVGTWHVDDPAFGDLLPMDTMTDDPVNAPGSGADRLQLMDGGDRLQVDVRPPRSCMDDTPPGAVAELVAGKHPTELHAHEFALLSFRAAGDDVGVYRYDVRFSTEPIDDERSFMRATPAKRATVQGEELVVPIDAAEGEMVRVEMGGLVQATRYFIAVRAMDGCASVGPVAVTEITTPTRVFATVTPCFVATAAYGSPLASEIGALRRLRDRYLLTHPLGRAAVDGYYRVGPAAAEVIARNETLRWLARSAMTPVVWLARVLTD